MHHQQFCYGSYLSEPSFGSHISIIIEATTSTFATDNPSLDNFDIFLFLLQGVAVIDNDFSHASANITSGGVGFSHVTVRMKSQRHHPLNFEVEIYV